MYTDNLIVGKNLAEAKKWLKKSASKDFEEAKKVLEEFVKQGIMSEIDTLSESEDDEVMLGQNASYSPLMSDNYELDFYNFGEDSLTESEEKELLNEILETKSIELKKMLRISESADTLVTEDTTAMGLINFAANSGSPEALVIKARLEENGLTIKQNYINAASNYLKAFRLGSFKAAEFLLKISQENGFYQNLEDEVKKDNPEAMFVWAGLIALGLDYSLTEEQAFELLKKAEEQDHINSIIELGLAYYSGSLVAKDSVQAIEYFEKAANLKSSEAIIRLAFIRIKDNENSNRSDDLLILTNFSNKGSVLAEAALAYCYEKGIAVEINKAKAANLYRQAAQRGNEAAYNSLRNMYDEIRPDSEEFQIYL